LLTLKLLPATIFFDDHVRDFIDPFVCRIAPGTLQTFPPTANGIAFLALPAVHDFVMQMIAKRAFHCDEASCPMRLRLCQSSPSFNPRINPTGTIATNVRAQRNSANDVASSTRTPNNSVSTRTDTTCIPPPTPGIWTTDPKDTNPIRINTSSNSKFTMPSN